MEHCLILTGRTDRRDAELSTEEEEGEVKTWEGGEKTHRCYSKQLSTQKLGILFEIVKGLLLIDYNMSSCAVVL